MVTQAPSENTGAGAWRTHDKDWFIYRILHFISMTTFESWRQILHQASRFARTLGDCWQIAGTLCFDLHLLRHASAVLYTR